MTTCAGCDPNWASKHLRHRLNASDVEFFQLVDVSKDFVELGAIHFHFLRRQFKVSQLGDPKNLFPANFHGDTAKAKKW